MPAHGRRRPALQRAARVAGAAVALPGVRLALSLAIILSLLPFRWVTDGEWAFFALFTVELLSRVVALAAPPERSHPDADPRRTWREWASALSLLALDLVALLSFVPWLVGLEEARWLRLFRLTRMALLLGYWAPLVRDLRWVLLRRERARQVLLMGVAAALLSFAGTVVLGQLGAEPVDYDGDGAVTSADASFAVRLWWAFRQVQDPGNMLASPVAAGAVVVSLALTVFGLFLVSFLIGLGTDVVRELMELGANRPPGLRGHTVLVGVTPATPPLLGEVMVHYDKARMAPYFAVIGRQPERPAFLQAPGMGRVVYRHGDPDDPGYLARVDARHAKRVLIMADTRERDPDATTLGLILSVREAVRRRSDGDEAPRALLVAEILEQGNAAAARVAGGAHTIIVPSEKLLGLTLGALVREPALEPLLLELITSVGCEIYSFAFGLAHHRSPDLRRPLPDFDRLLEAGLAGRDQARLVPVGWLVRDPLDEAGGDGAVRPATVVNPRGPAAPPPGEALGFLAVAPSFRAMRRFAGRVAAEPLPPCDAAALPAAWLAPAAADALPRRVVVCGLRPATLALCEGLVLADPDVSIRLLLDSDADPGRLDRLLAERETHARLGLLREHGPRGWFEAHPDGGLRYVPAPGAAPRGRVVASRGDWTADRVLVDLPDGGGHVGEADLVVFLGPPTARADGRTALSVLKLAELAARTPERFGPAFRVVAAVTDAELAAHLAARYRERVGPRARISVRSTRELRAFFNFQSTAVPGFDALYSELLSPSGQSFHRLVPHPAPPAEAAREESFVGLARALRAGGALLVGVEVEEADGERRLHVAPDAGAPGDRFARGALRAAWVIGGEALGAAGLARAGSPAPPA